MLVHYQNLTLSKTNLPEIIALVVERHLKRNLTGCCFSKSAWKMLGSVIWSTFLPSLNNFNSRKVKKFHFLPKCTYDHFSNNFYYKIINLIYLQLLKQNISTFVTINYAYFNQHILLTRDLHVVTTRYHHRMSLL